MYLEMLQQRYGAELEKQAMEKQALNPFQLAKLGKSFYNKGKGIRFEQLLAKRNNALQKVHDLGRGNHGRIAEIRDMKYRGLFDPARRERAYLGHNKGPLNKAMESADRRTIDFNTLPSPYKSPTARTDYLRKNMSDIAAPHYPYTAGTFSPDELASVATFARTNSPYSWAL